MRLSPLQIKKQEFEKSMRGYNVDDVQGFLEKISSEVEDVNNQNEQHESEIERLKKELDEFHRIEKKLQDSILKSQETSTQTIESAKKQSLLIIREAEVKASQIIQNAEEKVNTMQNAVMMLREEKDLIIARLRAIVGTQSNLLEGKVKEAGEEPRKPKAQDEAEKLDFDVDGLVDKLL